MRAVIICNGDFKKPDYIKKFIEKDDYIICADGGINHAMKMNIKPDIIIGDMDSGNPKAISYYEDENIPFVNFPSDKDNTDTDLAVDFAIEKGFSNILLVGATGGRLDHTMANIFLAVKKIEDNINIRIIDEKNQAFTCNNKSIIVGSKGDYLSLIPITQKVTGVTTKGLLYPLNSKTLHFGDTLSISNQLVNKTGIVEVKEGILLVICSRD